MNPADLPCVVYALMRGDSFAYVGRTHSIKKRIAQHKANKVAFDHFVVLAEVRQSEAPSVEEAAIFWLKPTLNKRGDSAGRFSTGPDGKTVRVALTVPDDVAPMLRALARSQNRSVSNYAALVLSSHLARKAA